MHHWHWAHTFSQLHLKVPYSLEHHTLSFIYLNLQLQIKHPTNVTPLRLCLLSSEHRLRTENTSSAVCKSVGLQAACLQSAVPQFAGPQSEYRTFNPPVSIHMNALLLLLLHYYYIYILLCLFCIRMVYSGCHRSCVYIHLKESTLLTACSWTLTVTMLCFSLLDSLWHWVLLGGIPQGGGGGVLHAFALIFRTVCIKATLQTYKLLSDHEVSHFTPETSPLCIQSVMLMYSLSTSTNSLHRQDSFTNDSVFAFWQKKLIDLKQQWLPQSETITSTI